VNPEWDDWHWKISLLVPSRGRPGQLKLMWDSARGTAVHPELLELIIYVDEDDDTMMRPARADDLPDNYRAALGPRILLSQTWNECYKLATGQILWHGNDDVIFRSMRWDMEIREGFRRFPDGIACVHGRDGIMNAGMATLGFYSRQWVNALGYFMPPYFSSDYNDTYLSTMADMIQRRVYLPEVYIEHMHPIAGKGEWDQTHQDRLARHVQDNVDQLYRDLAPQRVKDAARLQEAINAACG
jgi:hypothetical protein